MKHFDADVRGTAEQVWSRLADLRSYDEWLPRSGAFKGTGEISPGPIAVGTTYVERDPTGVRNGRVTELSKPTGLAFSQPHTMKPAALGTIGIEARYDLTQQGDRVRVRRSVEFTPQGPVKLVFPLVERMLVAENKRIMAALEASGDPG